MKKVKFSDFIIILILCIIFAAIIFIPRIIKRNRSDFEYIKFETKENYGANDVIPVYVDDKRMAMLYLKDFINNLIYDIDSSYLLLNVDYRESVFGSLGKYKSFINDLELAYDIQVKKYAVYESAGFKYYDIYDQYGHRFIFKTKGVMQYEIYFDDLDEGDNE